MEKVFFKIIIPNYNNMPYIKKCLDSILNQTFQDFKIIVVDDRSTDFSDDFCLMYSKKYPDKINFVKLDKKGHEGKARNAGINYPIECEYLYFIDGDDYLYNDSCLQKMYDNVKDSYPDILSFNLIQLVDNKFISLNYQTFNWNSFKLVSNRCSASAKIVKSNKIEYFLENSDYAADQYQWCKLLNNTPTVKTIDDIMYVYRRNPTSITKTNRFNKDMLKTYYKLKQLYKTLTNKNVINSLNNEFKTIENNIRRDRKLSAIKDLIEKYKLNEKTNKTKCIIIGAHPSLKDFKFQEYIDTSDAYIIRINRPPKQELFDNYGKKCDLIFGTEFAQELSDGFNNRVLLSDSDVKHISSFYKLNNATQLTTGFISIILFYSIFETIELFGFGYESEKDDVSKFKYSSVYENHKACSHDINNEHSLLDSILHNTSYITRLENR